MAFWSQFLEACGHTENVSIICRDGVLRSHKLVLANISKFMEEILKDIPTADEATIYLTDISKTDIEHFLQNAASDKSNLNQELESLFAIDISTIVPKQEIYEDKNSSPDEFPIRINIKSSTVKYENDPVKENEGFEGDASDSKPKSKVRKQYRYYDSKYLDKKERTEKALAALKSGEISSARAAAKIFGLSHSTLHRCFKENRVIARRGSNSKYLTRQEEELITNRILEESSEDELTFSRLKVLFWEEVMAIIAKYPEREEILLKMDPNTNTSFLSGFLTKHNLRRSKERTSFECGTCQIKFWSRTLLLHHQSEAHDQFDEEHKEELNKVCEIDDESSDEESDPLPESDETRNDIDFSNVDNLLEQRVKKLEEEKVENPTTEREKSRNEKVDRKIRCERAFSARMSGKVSSFREAGKMFNVSHSEVQRLVKYRKEGKFSNKHQLKYLSEQEEKHIVERVRSSATDSTDIDGKFVKKIFLEEIEILKINFPERAETLHKMKWRNIKDFIDRHDLCKESYEQRKKYLDEKRTFECEVCHKLYSNKKYILKHMRTVHSFLFT